MVNCKFCKTSFASQTALNLHEATAKACLKIQSSLGLSIPEPKHVCGCKKEFWRTDHYNSHIKACKFLANKQKTEVSIITEPVENSKIEATSSNTNNGIIIQPTITGNNNNVITNIYLNNMQPEYVLEKLKGIMTKQIFEQGMGEVVKNIIDGLLRVNDTYIYYCTDRSRATFKMLFADATGNVIEDNDPEAYELRELISEPVQILIETLKRKNGNHNLHGISETFRNLTSDGTEFKKELKTRLPSSSICYPKQKSEQKAAMKAQLQELIKDNERIEEERKIKKSEKLWEKITGNTTTYNNAEGYDQCYRNSINHWVMGWTSNNIKHPYIIGHSNSSDGQMMKLTKAQIEEIKTLNLERYLAPDYLPQLV